jgi:ABC-type branched-subunit amino acid transport system ATPase component
MTLLEATRLNKAFGGVRALHDVDVSLGAGETLGMIGPNGSGKTTFVNAVTGHIPLDGGSIRFGPHDTTRLRPHQLAAVGLTRTYQAVRVFGGLSTRRNVETALLLHRRDAPAPSEIDELAHWLRLDRMMDREAGALTLFEQRRLELLMRLVLKPRVIMLDEPVGGLAAPEVRAMIQLLAELKARCTIFLIEHTMRVIRELADRVVVLIAGQKVADGPPVEILRDQRVIDEYPGSAHARR